MPRNTFSPPTAPLDLNAVDPADTGTLSKSKATKKLDTLRGELEELTTLLYANRRRSLLIVLHGMDASGKDGTVRWLDAGINPMGLTVQSYKAPNEEELAHDFLWRVHRACPPRGLVGVFNRSHYEEVTTVRVHPEYLQRQRLPDEIVGDPTIWERRYRQIREFERTLVENGTIVIKFLLHISPEEQMVRLDERIENPLKRWKHNPSDLEERTLWNGYQRAFEAMIDATGTREAPWYVVPADHKWYRNYVVGSVVVETLRKLEMRWPE